MLVADIGHRLVEIAAIFERSLVTRAHVYAYNGEATSVVHDRSSDLFLEAGILRASQVSVARRISTLSASPGSRITGHPRSNETGPSRPRSRYPLRDESQFRSTYIGVGIATPVPGAPRRCVERNRAENLEGEEKRERENLARSSRDNEIALAGGLGDVIRRLFGH